MEVEVDDVGYNDVLSDITDDNAEEKINLLIQKQYQSTMNLCKRYTLDPSNPENFRTEFLSCKSIVDRDAAKSFAELMRYFIDEHVSNYVLYKNALNSIYDNCKNELTKIVKESNSFNNIMLGGDSMDNALKVKNDKINKLIENTKKSMRAQTDAHLEIAKDTKSVVISWSITPDVDQVMLEKCRKIIDTITDDTLSRMSIEYSNKLTHLTTCETSSKERISKKNKSIIRRNRNGCSIM